MSTFEKVTASEKPGKRKPFFRKPRGVTGKQDPNLKGGSNYDSLSAVV